MATKSATEKQARIKRLFGDGQYAEGHGGGLPLPPLFQTIAAELLDHGERTVADLVPPVEQVVGKRNRVTAPDMYPETGYDGLVMDALATLKSGGLAKQVNGHWEVAPKLQSRLGKRVKVTPGQGLTITLHPKEERARLSAAAIEDRELQAMYNDLRNDRAFEVKVRGERSRKQFRIHPLAISMPPMPYAEFKDLAENIKRDGVAYPIIVHEKLVVDGRHRLAIASALGQPVSVEPYRGTEDVAAFVVSVNKDRHGWSKLERALIVLDYYYPQAKKEAEERRLAELKYAGESLAPIGTNDSGKALAVANERSGGMASLRTLQRLLPVLEAPKTRQRIITGEIKSAVQAYQEANRERGIDVETKDATPLPRSAWERLGLARHALQKSNEALASGNIGPAHVSLAPILERHQEISALLEENERLARQLAEEQES